jgi:hypothetical protein
MNNNKSPGIHNILAKLNKKGGRLLFNKLHSLVEGIWREKKIPTDWKTNIIVPMYKNREIIGEYQAGFRTGNSTIDQIFTVKNLLEKAWEHNVKIH